MKKTVIILLITLFSVIGCTKIPASSETGVKPGEYEGQMKTDQLKSENESLKTELEQAKTDLKKLEEDYLSLSKNNDMATLKLNDAESIIMLFQDNKIPKFAVEKADKNNIVNYLNEKSNFLSNSYKGIEIIPVVSVTDKIIFYTVGYGENHNQLFMWDIAKTEPIIIEGANFDDKGSWKWLLQDKYIILSSSDNTNKILDISTMKLTNEFNGIGKGSYMFSGTTSILIKKDASATESPFVVYDFISGEEKEFILDNKSKYDNFTVNENNNEILFTGTYDENEISYSVEAIMNIDKIKEKYVMKTNKETGTTSEGNA